MLLYCQRYQTHGITLLLFFNQVSPHQNCQTVITTITLQTAHCILTHFRIYELVNAQMREPVSCYRLNFNRTQTQNHKLFAVCSILYSPVYLIITYACFSRAEFDINTEPFYYGKRWFHTQDDPLQFHSDLSARVKHVKLCPEKSQ